MHRKITSLLLMVFLLMQPIVYAEELLVDTESDLDFTTELIMSKSAVYPNLGKEHLVDPAKNFYYINYSSRGQYVKTEEYRFADNRLMRVVYPDKTIVVIDSTPLTEKDVQLYCEKYNYVPKAEIKKVEVPVKERYQVIAEELIKEDKLIFFVNYYIKTGYYFEIDEKTEELLSIFFEKDEMKFKSKKFSRFDMKEINEINWMVIEADGWVEVMIYPYACDKYLEGTILEFNGSKAIVLFNNDKVSLKKQYEKQIKILLAEQDERK